MLNIGRPLRQYTPWYSHLYAIASVDRNFNDWLYCNNIDLILQKNDTDQFYKGLAISFMDVPDGIEIKSIPREIINFFWNELSFFIAESLSLGYYVLIDIDPYYISSYKKNYYNVHSNNTVLVYNYNNLKFDIGAFNKYPCYNYCKLSISAEELNSALNFDYLVEKPSWFAKINLVSFRHGYMSFSIEKLKNKVSCFDKNYILENDSNVITYGSKVFDEMRYDLTNTKKINKWISDSLLEYNRLMMKRYIYLVGNKYIVDYPPLELLIKNNLHICKLLSNLKKISISNIEIYIYKLHENTKKIIYALKDLLG